MSFETELKTHLQAGSAVVALVSTRITPIKLKDGAAMPALVYSAVFGDPQNTLDGFDSARVRYRVQLDCWALTAREVYELALAVRDRMNVDATNFKSYIIAFPSFDDFESTTERYRRTIECSCWHRES